MKKKSFLLISLLFVSSACALSVNKTSFELATAALKFAKELFIKAIIETTEELAAKKIKEQAKKL